MAASVGTAHDFGVIKSVSGFSTWTIQNIDIRQNARLVPEVVDESGIVIHRRYVDEEYSGTVVGIAEASASLAAVESGDTLVIGGKTYEITSIGDVETNEGFRQLTMEVRTTSGISYA